MLSFYAFRHMSLSDASVIIFSTPVFVIIFAKIFLNEPCGLFNVATIFLTIMGVILITRPPLLFNDMDEGAALPIVHTNSSLNFFGNDESAKTLSYTNEAEKDAKAKFDIWGPVAAISSTLFGAVRIYKQMIILLITPLPFTECVRAS